jgi:hypothetical protein
MLTADFSPVPPKSEAEEEKKAEKMYDKLPESFKAECLVRAKPDEDEEKIKRRQELTRAMSPAQLAEIHGFSDFPIPTLRKKKKEKDLDKESEASKSKENLYEKLPSSLKTECLVRSKVDEDEEKLKQRQELTRAQSPAALGAIHGFSDFPIPTFRKKKKEVGEETKSEKSKSREDLYGKLPESLKSECLVRSKVEEDEEKLKKRQEMTRAMSPSELSKIHGFGDIPFPSLKKKKKESPKDELDKSKSNENLYAKMPESLKTECLVRNKMDEDEEKIKQRQELTRAMSPSELGQIRGFGDIPIPTFRKKKKDVGDESKSDMGKSKENLYEKLPSSLKAECLVRSKVEVDEEKLKERQNMTRSMSPHELGQIHGLSDFPIPSFKKKAKTPEASEDVSKSKENLYQKLPSSLKAECLVRTKVEVDEEVLKERQNLARSMSPAELGEIHGLSDIPFPSFSKKKKDEKEKR